MIANAQLTLFLHHFRQVLEEAAKRGIDIAPLKGAHLVTSVYPVEKSRYMCDVDFLIRPDDWFATIEMMHDLGFRRRITLARENWNHEVGFDLDVTPQISILFEPHRYLIEPRRFTIDHDAIWRRAQPSTLDGAPCFRLAAEDHIVHACLHSSIHRCVHRDRTVTDLEMLFRHGAPDPSLVIERAREWKVTRATWLFAQLLSEQAPDLELVEITDSLKPDRLVRSVLLTLVSGKTFILFSRLHHRLRAALLWPLLFDSPIDVARLVANHPLITKLVVRSQGF